jgi:hypothetical protein
MSLLFRVLQLLLPAVEGCRFKEQGHMFNQPAKLLFKQSVGKRRFEYDGACWAFQHGGFLSVCGAALGCNARL